MYTDKPVNGIHNVFLELNIVLGPDVFSKFSKVVVFYGYISLHYGLVLTFS